MKKTAMQLLIDIIKSSKQEVDAQGVGICEVLDYHGIEDKATELLETERDQIEEAYDEGAANVDSGYYNIQYYKDTYQ
jgi:hypothetical protein